MRVKTTSFFMPHVVTDMGFIKDNQFATIIREICTDDFVGEIQAPEFLGAAYTKCFIDRGDLSPVLIILNKAPFWSNWVLATLSDDQRQVKRQES